MPCHLLSSTFCPSPHGPPRSSQHTIHLSNDPPLYGLLMRTLLPLSLVPLLLSCLDLVGAIRLEIHGRSPRWEDNALEVAQKRGLTVQKRSNIHTDHGSGILTNSDDITYYSSLTLGGKKFDVLIDTGKSPQASPFVRFPSPLTLHLSVCRKVNPTLNDQTPEYVLIAFCFRSPAQTCGSAAMSRARKIPERPPKFNTPSGLLKVLLSSRDSNSLGSMSQIKPSVCSSSPQIDSA